MRIHQLEMSPPKTLDPRLTIIRTREVGADFYDSVMQRIAAQPERPTGVMVHFSGYHDDEFFVVSIYRDAEAASKMFVQFTGPEVVEEIHLSGGADIARREFQVTRYAIGDIEGLGGFRITPPGEFIAVYITGPQLTREHYLATTSRARFPEDWPAGMLMHVAGEFGDRWGIFDIWHEGANLAEFYNNRIQRAIDELFPEVESGIEQREQAIVLHSLMIEPAAIGEDFEYLRDG